MIQLILNSMVALTLPYSLQNVDSLRSDFEEGGTDQHDSIKFVLRSVALYLIMLAAPATFGFSLPWMIYYIPAIVELTVEKRSLGFIDTLSCSYSFIPLSKLFPFPIFQEKINKIDKLFDSNIHKFIPSFLKKAALYIKTNFFLFSYLPLIALTLYATVMWQLTIPCIFLYFGHITTLLNYFGYLSNNYKENFLTNIYNSSQLFSVFQIQSMYDILPTLSISASSAQLFIAQLANQSKGIFNGVNNIVRLLTALVQILILPIITGIEMFSFHLVFGFMNIYDQLIQDFKALESNKPDKTCENKVSVEYIIFSLMTIRASFLTRLSPISKCINYLPSSISGLLKTLASYTTKFLSLIELVIWVLPIRLSSVIISPSLSFLRFLGEQTMIVLLGKKNLPTPISNIMQTINAQAIYFDEPNKLKDSRNQPLLFRLLKARNSITRPFNQLTNKCLPTFTQPMTKFLTSTLHFIERLTWILSIQTLSAMASLLYSIIYLTAKQVIKSLGRSKEKGTLKILASRLMKISENIKQNTTNNVIFKGLYITYALYKAVFYHACRTISSFTKRGRKYPTSIDLNKELDLTQFTVDVNTLAGTLYPDQYKGNEAAEDDSYSKIAFPKELLLEAINKFNKLLKNNADYRDQWQQYFDEDKGTRDKAEPDFDKPQKIIESIKAKLTNTTDMSTRTFKQNLTILLKRFSSTNQDNTKSSDEKERDFYYTFRKVLNESLWCIPRANNEITQVLKEQSNLDAKGLINNTLYQSRTNFYNKLVGVIDKQELANENVDERLSKMVFGMMAAYGSTAGLLQLEKFSVDFAKIEGLITHLQALQSQKFDKSFALKLNRTISTLQHYKPGTEITDSYAVKSLAAVSDKLKNTDYSEVIIHHPWKPGKALKQLEKYADEFVFNNKLIPFGPEQIDHLMILLDGYFYYNTASMIVAMTIQMDTDSDSDRHLHEIKQIIIGYELGIIKASYLKQTMLMKIFQQFTPYTGIGKKYQEATSTEDLISELRTIWPGNDEILNQLSNSVIGKADSELIQQKNEIKDLLKDQLKDNQTAFSDTDLELLATAYLCGPDYQDKFIQYQLLTSKWLNPNFKWEDSNSRWEDLNKNDDFNAVMTHLKNGTFGTADLSSNSTLGVDTDTNEHNSSILQNISTIQGQAKTYKIMPDNNSLKSNITSMINKLLHTEYSNDHIDEAIKALFARKAELEKITLTEDQKQAIIQKAKTDLVAQYNKLKNFYTKAQNLVPTLLLLNNGILMSAQNNKLFQKAKPTAKQKITSSIYTSLDIASMFVWQPLKATYHAHVALAKELLSMTLLHQTISLVMLIATVALPSLVSAHAGFFIASQMLATCMLFEAWNQAKQADTWPQRALNFFWHPKPFNFIREKTKSILSGKTPWYKTVINIACCALPTVKASSMAINTALNSSLRCSLPLLSIGYDSKSNTGKNIPN
jgi:hypothetical protein